MSDVLFDLLCTASGSSLSGERAEEGSAEESVHTEDWMPSGVDIMGTLARGYNSELCPGLVPRSTEEHHRIDVGPCPTPNETLRYGSIA